MISVLVVDDHDGVRQSLGCFIEMWDDTILVGEATNGFEAVTLCKRMRPDVVLMDIGMPRMDGIVATRIISDRYPTTRVIALAGFQDIDRIEDAIASGAARCMVKNFSIDALYAAIRGEQHLYREGQR